MRGFPVVRNQRMTMIPVAWEMEIDAPNPDQLKEEELFRAAEGGDSSLFSALTHDQLSGALALRNDDGRSLLHVATSAARPEIVRILADADRSTSMINSKHEEGWTPIHSASSIANVQIVEILLNKGADVNLKNDGGRTALHYAASKGWSKVAEILIAHGAKIDLKDKVGTTTLHRAASTGKSEVCELLIQEGADIDPVDKAGQIPLMAAVICPNKEVALLLIRHGADVDIEDEGYTVHGRALDDFRPALIDAAKAMVNGGTLPSGNYLSLAIGLSLYGYFVDAVMTLMLLG